MKKRNNYILMDDITNKIMLLSNLIQGIGLEDLIKQVHALEDDWYELTRIIYKPLLENERPNNKE